MHRDGTPDVFDRDREAHEDAQQLFMQHVTEALRARFRAMGLVRAATWGNPERWSRDDLATDLAPQVAAAIHVAVLTAGQWTLERIQESRPLAPGEEVAFSNAYAVAALAALRAETP